MRIITLTLALTFFILSLMVIGGSMNMFSNMREDVKNDSRQGLQGSCVTASYSLEGISYEQGILSFTVQHRDEFSSEPVLGLQLRPADDSTLYEVSTGVLRYGMSRDMEVVIPLGEDQAFYVSLTGCSSDYERLCHVRKSRC